MFKQDDLVSRVVKREEKNSIKRIVLPTPPESDGEEKEPVIIGEKNRARFEAMERAKQYLESEAELNNLLNDTYDDVKPQFHDKFRVNELKRDEDWTDKPKLKQSKSVTWNKIATKRVSGDQNYQFGDDQQSDLEINEWKLRDKQCKFLKNLSNIEQRFNSVSKESDNVVS